MNPLALVYPMFCMVALTAVVLAALFRSRKRAVRSGLISVAYFRTYRGEAEPEDTVKLSRHFANIFEAPTLFYAACLGAMIMQQTAIVFHLLAWAYVGLRVAHAYIHTGSNRLRHRIPVYFSSWLVLVAMWLFLVADVSLNYI